METRLTNWDHARAALLVIVLLVHGLFAAPVPKAVKASTLKTPAGREEITRWHDVLTTFVDVDRETFEVELVDWSNWAAGFPVALKKPFRPFRAVTGTGQGWALFAAPDTHPHRFEVYVQRQGHGWERVLARLDDEDRWMHPTVTFRRVRGVYDGSTKKALASYNNLTRWLAVRAFEDFPDAQQVKVQMVRTHIVLPHQAPDDLNQPRMVRKYDRGEL